jgi:hypothetical protein
VPRDALEVRRDAERRRMDVVPEEVLGSHHTGTALGCIEQGLTLAQSSVPEFGQGLAQHVLRRASGACHPGVRE